MTSRIAVLVADGFDKDEFNVAAARLRQAGHEVVVAGPCEGERVWSEDGSRSATVDTTPTPAAAERFDALVIPGGRAPTALGRDRAAVDFVRRFVATGRLVAATCDGPRLLLEAGVVAGRTLTSRPAARSSLTDAGAAWIDATVVLDGNLITSRRPEDIEHLCSAVLSRLQNPLPAPGRAVGHPSP